MSDDPVPVPAPPAGLFPSPESVDSVCLGAGRFLRSVLVPALVGSGLHPAIVQTRGRTFLDHCLSRLGDGGDVGDGGTITYEVDSVGYDGTVATGEVQCYGAGTMGTEAGAVAVAGLLGEMKMLSIIGVGVTEAGLASPRSKSLVDLCEILRACHRLMSGGTLLCPNPNGRVCVVNTDNVPRNGSVVQGRVLAIARGNGEPADASFLDFLSGRVAFLDSMVDRITSQREGPGGLVPRCEPVPDKALVIEDLGGDLPVRMGAEDIRREYGVVVRSRPGQLDADVALKLRVANGTHTAAAQTMALCSLLKTDILSSSDGGASLLMEYLDAFFESQVLPAAVAEPDLECGEEETRAVWKDWRRRLCHPHFGLSSFFITQNCAAKGGIRIGPTVLSLVKAGKPVSVATAFAIAAILRFLTPAEPISDPSSGIYRGWLDGADRSVAARPSETDGDSVVMYADGLHYDISKGWYEFRASCSVSVGSSRSIPISSVLGNIASFPKQPREYAEAIAAYLCKEDGGNLAYLAETKGPERRCFNNFVAALSTLYSRMVAGDGMLSLLGEMSRNEGVYAKGLNTECTCLIDSAPDERRNDQFPLHYNPSPIPEGSKLLKVGIGNDRSAVSSVLFGEVAAVETIDLHTHLLPPSHGSLCLWGIDELLAYHYLVAEFFQTAPPDITPEGFYALSKQRQADIIWKALFVDRTPISEACRGVITTLLSFGLETQVHSRNLDDIRKWYQRFRDDGLAGAEQFSESVYKLAGVRYAVMTNIPFDTNEAQCWRPKRKEYPDQFKSALRVDPLLAGDRRTIEAALSASGYDKTLEGARQYLRDWCDTMKPEYMMASTPHNFVLPEGTGGNLVGVKKTGVNEEAMKQPFAFADETSPDADCGIKCDGEDDATASIIDENSNFLSEVLMKVCEEQDLPLALKIGAHRGVNPKLLQAGDGVVAFADAGVLARLCTRFPRVRFLATFLSRNNQHEACVLASKFRNLHIYGCWWFCNNPSMIKEITTMRVEMLGTAFTAQHSDARVLDQLVYKWSHSRGIIATVLAKEYIKLIESGWIPTRGEVRRDVKRLFGGSYEEFMAKSFTKVTYHEGSRKGL